MTVLADLKAKSKEELLEIARQRSIKGRSEMDKDELATAIAQSYRDNPPPEPRIG